MALLLAIGSNKSFATIRLTNAFLCPANPYVHADSRIINSGF